MFSLYAILSLAAAALAAQCPFPEIPKNGFAEMYGSRLTFHDAEAVSFNVGNVVKYSCESEWALFSNEGQYIGCQEDGTWKGTVPKCYLRETTENWSKIGSNKDVVDFKSNLTCNTPHSKFHFWPQHAIPLFDVKEVNVRLCDQVSDNDRLKVKLKGILSNITVDCKFQLVSYEGHKFTCQQDISNETLEFILIEPSRSISIKEATVLLSTGDDCGSPAIPMNGNAHFISGHRYRYTCDEGFDLCGNEYVECNPSTLRWSAVPTCERVIYDTIILENVTEEMKVNETLVNETEILDNTTTEFDVREETKYEVSGAAGLNSWSYQLHSMWMALCLFCLSGILKE